MAVNFNSSGSSYGVESASSIEVSSEKDLTTGWSGWSDEVPPGARSAGVTVVPTGLVIEDSGIPDEQAVIRRARARDSVGTLTTMVDGFTY